MSLILDALKRADAERSRGSVPGLHAQPLASAPASTPRGGNGRWLAMAALAAVVLLAALAWSWGTRGEAPAGTSAPAPAPAPKTAPAPVAAPAPAPVPPLVQVPPVAPPPATPAATPPVVAPGVPTAAPARAAKATASTPAAADERVPTLAELPEDVRKQLPTLVISGSIYSPNPAQRLLTIGSQVFQEGDRPAPELVLERIGQKSAVFNFRGQRYSVAF